MKQTTTIIGLVLSSFLIVTQFLFAESCCPDSKICKPNGVNENKMLIPEDKNFSKSFMKKLYARGEKEVYSGKDIELRLKKTIILNQ